MGLVVVVGVSWCWFCSLSHHVLMLACVYFCLDVTDDAEHRSSPLGSMTEETSADLDQTFTGSSSVLAAAIVMFIDATSYL